MKYYAVFNKAGTWMSPGLATEKVEALRTLEGVRALNEGEYEVREVTVVPGELVPEMPLEELKAALEKHDEERRKRYGF